MSSSPGHHAGRRARNIMDRPRRCWSRPPQRPRFASSSAAGAAPSPPCRTTRFPGQCALPPAGAITTRHRLVALGGDRTASAILLESFLDNRQATDLVVGTAVSGAKLAFVFSGNGAQFPEMGRAALRANPTFRCAIENVDGILRPQLGWSIAELIDQRRRRRAGGAHRHCPTAAIRHPGRHRRGAARDRYHRFRISRAQRRRDRGRLGRRAHSHLQMPGASSIARSRSQQRTQGSGRMAALALDGDAARSFLSELDSTAEIAALNATRSVTISGSGAEIERLADEARRRNLWCRPLDLDFAFHSRWMDPIHDELLISLSGISSLRPTARLGIERHRRRHRRRCARRPSLVAKYQESGALRRGDRRADRRRLSHLCSKSGLARSFTPI